MTFDTSLLAIICCPVTQLPLELMSQSDLRRLNERIGERKIKQRDDTLVEQPLEQALVTRDGKLAYPVRDGIPILLEEQAILLSQLEIP